MNRALVNGYDHLMRRVSGSRSGRAIAPDSARSARCALRLLIAIALAFHPAIARADFDPQRGRVVFDDAAAATSMDEWRSELGDVALLDRSGFAIPVGNTHYPRDPDISIEGWGFLRLGDRAWGAIYGLENVADSLRDRRIEVKVWMRPEGTVAVVDLIYSNQPYDETVIDLYTAHSARLFPTGRATSDGWRELSTGAIDFALSGEFEARAIRILDQRLMEFTFFGYPSNENGRTAIDGVAIYDRGLRAVPDAPCRSSTEDVCGDVGACFMGRCVDAAPVVGNIPRDLDLRYDYLSALAHRMQIFLGGRYPLAQAEAFEQRLADLVNERSFSRYWSRFHRAFDDFGDGHISEAPLGFPPTFGNGACIYEGDADLIGAGIKPLVFETDAGHPVGSRLARGDVIMAIDGIPHEEWLERSDRLVRYGGDARGRRFITTSQILIAGLEGGALLTVRRPGVPDTFEVDLSEITAPFFEGDPLDWRWDDLVCDFRLERDVPNPGRDYDFVGHSARDGIRTILINGVSGSGGWISNVQLALTGDLSMVILDERTGHGGTFEGVGALLDPFLEEAAFPVAHLIPQVVPELDEPAHTSLIRCNVTGFEACGNFFYLPMAGGFTQLGAAQDARIAILNAFDVSGNDYLPRTLRDRPTGETRVFAPVPSFGAFGPILYLPRLMDEVWGGSAQLHDTLFIRNDAFNLDFNTGHGVEPDVVVYQKLTDLIEGRDTLVEAARAWLLEGN